LFDELYSCHPVTGTEWFTGKAEALYAGEVRHISSTTWGLHFCASALSADKINEFSLPKFGQQFAMEIPHVWHLLIVLLAADPETPHGKILMKRRTEMKMKTFTANSATTAQANEGGSIASIMNIDAEEWARITEDLGLSDEYELSEEPQVKATGKDRAKNAPKTS
jgi:hypothetical protein